jgi:two-component sensor histidine kinase
MSAINPNRSEPASDFPELAEVIRPAKTETSFLFTSRKAMLLTGVLAALLVFMVGAGLDWFVLHENESRTIAISLSDSLAAVIAGVLVFRLMLYERDRRKFVRQRLEIIAEMNHHVRNALQVISLSAHTSYADKQQLEAVKASVNRIQWALKEILPKL